MRQQLAKISSISGQKNSSERSEQEPWMRQQLAQLAQLVDKKKWSERSERQTLRSAIISIISVKKTSSQRSEHQLSPKFFNNPLLKQSESTT